MVMPVAAAMVLVLVRLEQMDIPSVRRKEDDRMQLEQQMDHRIHVEDKEKVHHDSAQTLFVRNDERTAASVDVRKDVLVVDWSAVVSVLL